MKYKNNEDPSVQFNSVQFSSVSSPLTSLPRTLLDIITDFNIEFT